MDATQLATAITQLETQLTALGAAILARTDPTTAEYSLDTGQSVQRWKGHTLGDLFAYQTALMNQLCMLQLRQNGGGATLGVPGF